MRSLIAAVVTMVISCSRERATPQPAPAEVKQADAMLSAVATSDGSVSIDATVAPSDAETHDAAAAAVTPRVLYIEGGMLEAPASANYLRKALESEKIEVEVRGPHGLPSRIEELEKYDVLIVSDVSADLMSRSQMAAMEAYVKGGGGFILAHGDKIGTSHFLTSLESLAPVRIDGDPDPKPATFSVALVLDRSSGVTPQLAKEMTRAIVDVLEPEDRMVVIAFDSDSTVLVRPTRVTNRVRIENDVARFEVSTGGKNMFVGMKEAGESLATIPSRVVHAILVSGGTGTTDIDDLVTSLRAEVFTTSVIGLPSADRDALGKLAEAGRGRLHMIAQRDLSALPRVVMNEVRTLRKLPLSVGIHAVVGKQDAALDGIDIANAPVLLGHVGARAKPNADVLLTIRESGEPLLARWRVGAGWSVAWMSDVKNQWSAKWVDWPGYTKLWTQLVRTSMRVK